MRACCRIIHCSSKTFLGCLDQSNDYNGYQCQTHRESYCFTKGNENWYQQFQFTCMNTCGFCEGKCVKMCNMIYASYNNVPALITSFKKIQFQYIATPTQVERSLLTRRALLHILEYKSLANGSAIRMLGMKANVKAQHAK